MKVERSSLEQVKERFNKNKRKFEEKVKEYDLEQKVKEAQEMEERQKELRRENKKKKKVEETGTAATSSYDDDMMSMMGFSGFGGARKNIWKIYLSILEVNNPENCTILPQFVLAPIKSIS